MQRFRNVRSSGFSPAFALAALLLVQAGPGREARADEIIMKNGRTISGQIVEQREDGVKIRTLRSELTIPSDLIEEVRIEEIPQKEAEGDLALRAEEFYEALRLYRAAREAEGANERLDEKIENVTQRIADLEREKYDAQFQKGLDFWKGGNLKEARDAFEELLQSAPAQTLYAEKARRALAYVWIAEADRLVDRVEYQQAIRAYERATEAAPELACAYLELGRIRDKHANDRRGALEDLRKGLDLARKDLDDPKAYDLVRDFAPPKSLLDENAFADYRYRYAEILFELRRRQEAAEEFLGLLEESSEHLTTEQQERIVQYVEAAYTEDAVSRRIDREKALAQLDVLLGLNPHSARAWYLKGRIFLDHGDAQKAVEAFAEAIRIDPSFPEAYLNRAQAYMELKQVAEARRDLERELRNGESYAVRQMLGEVLLMGSEFDEALLHFNRAIEMQPDKPLALLGRAETYRLQAMTSGMEMTQRMALLEKAEKDIDHVLQMNEKHRRAILEASRLMKNQKDFDRAAQLLKQLIDDLSADGIQLLLIDEKDLLANAYIERGDLHFQTENYAQAREDFLQALAIKPGSGLAVNKLGLVAEKQTEYDRAEERYKEAIAMEPQNAAFELSLAILYHQSLERYAEAIVHYEAYREKGGVDLRLDGWIRECRNALIGRPLEDDAGPAPSADGTGGGGADENAAD